ncbi:outer membrane protein assembly factor [Guyparkeria sp. SCN-R1]|uniref:autotransporter assembly complex protein TamA n=1 Tax=Guyparkeria sp. SCN-R1 TaxID=2341113 RepID=UPI000F6465FE|nr:autotransporter assembly complex family protein [Guyparkeria sp. SCN-R1]RRQ24641.1 outer membrane protein assembly factor [Guyparkeria sp. SCN-R1]
MPRPGAARLALAMLAMSLLFGARAAMAAPSPQFQLTGLSDSRLITNVGLSVPRIGFSCEASTAHIRRYLDAASEAAEEALQAYGYFNARIRPSIQRRAECRDPALDIDAGPVTTIESVSIDLPESIREIESVRKFVSERRPQEGSPLDQAAYDSLRDGVLSRVQKLGYLDARFTRRELVVDPATQSARIALALEAGSRYRFGEVVIEQSILEPELARRLTGVPPGAAYTSRDLLAMNRNLTGTEYFESVSVRPRLDQRENLEVPVEITTYRNPRTSYELRAGYATDVGPRVGAGVKRRYVNKRGHQWSARTQLSAIEQRLETSYTIPRAADPLRERYDIYARVTREDNNDIVTTAAASGVQWVRETDRWTRSLFTEYLLDRTRYGDDPPESNGFAIVGGRLGYQGLDDPLFPTEGVLFDVSLQGAAEPIASAASFVRGRAFAGGYLPVGKWIFAGRAEAGVIVTDQFDKMPRSLRFFTGGDRSVRGYEYESLSPRDEDGTLIGGKYLLAGSLEAMFPVVGDDWYLAAFVDSGNAYTDPEAELKTGAGVGVRWRSPVGIVRVDIAQPLDGSDGLPMLHLGLGAAF